MPKAGGLRVVRPPPRLTSCDNPAAGIPCQLGGYTVRVLFKREPPEKQREIEALFKIPR
jgi:hypothetical protein